MTPVVPMSMTRASGLRPSTTPSLPNSTASTVGVSGSMVMTVSALAATAAGDPAGTAPARASS